MPTRRALALKLVDLGSSEKMSDFCARAGISASKYRELMDDPLMFEEIWDSSFQMMMVPQIPAIMQRWAEKCRGGDISALKLLMQYKGKSQPEQHAHVHLHKEVNKMSSEQLDAEIKEAVFQLKALDKEAM